MCAPACWVVYLYLCTIACLPAVGQEFHTELVKQQEATESRGNGHKPVPLSTVFRLLLHVLFFPAPVPAFLTLLTSRSLTFLRLRCKIGLVSAIGCWVSLRAILLPFVSSAMTYIFFFSPLRSAQTMIGKSDHREHPFYLFLVCNKTCFLITALLLCVV